MTISRTFPRLVARVHGDRALEFLHAVSTQDVQSLSKGTSILACHLDEKGHVLAEFRIAVDDDGAVAIDAEPAAREGIERMARIAPLSGCELEIGEMTMTSIRGEATPPPGALEDPWGGFDVLAEDEVAIDAPRVGDEQWTLARIEAGRPLYGVDVTADSIVNETPLLSRAVSFTKGCYPGQETVARIFNLGQRRKKLARLRWSGGTAPPSVTSWARAADDSVGLGVVRAELEGSVDLDGVRLTVEPID